MLQQAFIYGATGFRHTQKKCQTKPKVKVLNTILTVWFQLHGLTFISVESGCPSPWSLDPFVATLWCSFRSERDWAGVDQAMLVLTEFPAVVVSIKLEFYVNWREWDRHMLVLRERGM